MRVYVLLLLTLCYANTHSQRAIDYFRPVEQQVRGEGSFNRLYARLDSLEKKHMPSRSFITLYLNRDIDAGYVHKRVQLRLNDYAFQLDFLTKGDSICFTAVLYNEGKHHSYYEWNDSAMDHFLARRNKLYGTKKQLSHIKRELTYKESFATHCGEALSITPKGKEIYELVEEEDLEAIREMTKSISPEIQAYGVLGIEQLEKRGISLQPYDYWVIAHLKKRNTEVITCSGCLDGIVTHLYTKQ